MEAYFSLIVFFILLGFFIYEIIAWIRSKKEQDKPVIPDFNPSSFASKSPIVAATVYKPEKVQQQSFFLNKQFILLVILFVLLLLFGGLTISSFRIQKQVKKVQNNLPQIVTTEISSQGIRLYGMDWKEFTAQTYKNIKKGQKVYIGIETIPEANINYARIRVNNKLWSQNDITMLFNDEKKVYYKEYTIASSEAKMQIDAQLHSVTDGWLGD